MNHRDPDDPHKKVAWAAALGVALSVLSLGLLTWMAVDVDSDGASSYAEMREGTSPMRGDTDGDGVADGWEMARGFDALSAASTPVGVSNTPVDSPCSDVVLLVGECVQSDEPMESGGPTPPPAGGNGAGATSLITASTVSVAMLAGRFAMRVASKTP